MFALVSVTHKQNIIKTQCFTCLQLWYSVILFFMSNGAWFLLGGVSCLICFESSLLHAAMLTWLYMFNLHCSNWPIKCSCIANNWMCWMKPACSWCYCGIWVFLFNIRGVMIQGISYIFVNRWSENGEVINSGPCMFRWLIQPKIWWPS